MRLDAFQPRVIKVYQRRMGNLRDEIKQMETLRAWSAEAIRIADEQLAALDAYEKDGVGDLGEISKTRLPPCPVCGGHVTRYRRLRLDYGSRFSPCGCHLGIESWQTRLTRRCASTALALLVASFVLAVIPGAGDSPLVDIGTAAAVALVAVALFAVFLPRNEFAYSRK